MFRSRVFIYYFVSHLILFTLTLYDEFLCNLFPYIHICIYIYICCCSLVHFCVFALFVLRQCRRFSFVLCVPTHIHFSFCLVLFHIFQFSHPMCSFCISHVSITCYLFHLSVYFFICHAYVFEFVCLLFIVSCVLAFPAVFYLLFVSIM